MNNTNRFSNRVENYVKYRPSYPQTVIDYLSEAGINKQTTLADIGSGTGILSSLLVEKVEQLYAIEPNREMRLYAEAALDSHVNFHSLPSTAEATLLPDSSADIITVAQAFHWFDRKKCKSEFSRILKPGGKVFLIWNNRVKNTPFLQKFDELLHKYGTDYAQVNHQNLTDIIIEDFFNSDYQKTSFDNVQELDLEGFLGRVFSSSYTPTKDQPLYDEFLIALKNLFEEYKTHGIVQFNYETDVFSGKII